MQVKLGVLISFDVVLHISSLHVNFPQVSTAMYLSDCFLLKCLSYW